MTDPLAAQLRIDADEIAACGAGNEAANMWAAADRLDAHFHHQAFGQAFYAVWEQAIENHTKYSATGDDLSDQRFLTLGLCGEAGELANFVKKEWRDGISHENDVRYEAADVLAYLLMFCWSRQISPGQLIAIVAHKQAIFVEKMKARDASKPA